MCCNILLLEVKKHVELWLIQNLCHCDKDSFLFVLTGALVEILKNGFRRNGPNSFHVASNGERLRKLMDDFEWLHKSAQRSDVPRLQSFYAAPTEHFSNYNSIEQFFLAWTLRNLKLNCLCACLRELVAESDLLAYYYSEGAFLRSEAHATALFICLSALELNQPSLLSQVENCLNAGRSASANALTSKHRRTSSQPTREGCVTVDPTYENHQAQFTSSSTLATAKPILSAFRRVKSMPLLNVTIPQDQSAAQTERKACARSKRLSKSEASGLFPSKPSELVMVAASTASSSQVNRDRLTPTGSKSTEASNLTLNSCSDSNASFSTASPTPSSASSARRRIKLIQCDDIKIWTDQSCQQQHMSSTYAIPESSNLAAPAAIGKVASSVSPINSLLCQLFRTPPAYTNWSSASFQLVDEAETTATAVDAIASTPHFPINTRPSESPGMFDAFRTFDGQKLRTRKAQNFFDDSSNYLHFARTPETSESHMAHSEEDVQGAAQTAPKQQQTLMSFLQMAQLSRNHTELEQENAHFRIAETIISVMEHMKWAKLEPDKRRPSDIATECLKSDQPQTGPKQLTEVDPNLEVVSTITEEEASNECVTCPEVGECCLDLLSAEVVGLSLIARFNNKQLPKVSELKWLVSDADTPQQLLPLPTAESGSYSLNADDCVMPSVTRGTQYWAPPRQQIIFTEHTPPNRRVHIEKQNNRCAGCGMRVSPDYIQSFRYCYYLGKYFCTGCHRNQIATIPAKILHCWDFKCYPVSVFSYRLLEQMYTFPLFHVPDLNASLYKRAAELLKARQGRMRLKFVQQFIITCRYAIREQRYFDAVPSHITADPDMWAMSDFADAQQKSLQRSIDELISRCEHHIFNCVLCAARGFICEHCLRDHIIYPWQHKIVRCDCCGTCYHQKCWKSMRQACTKCLRRLSKKPSLVDITDRGMLQDDPVVVGNT